LSGDRYHCSGYCPESKEVYFYDVCCDCLYYAEYGQLDDVTMMDMEEEEEGERPRLLKAGKNYYFEGGKKEG